MDIGASFKITAGVVGQQAVDRLNDSTKQLTGFAKSAGLALAGLGAGLGLSVLASKFDEVVASAAGLKDIAERTGSTVENMGALARAASLTNNEFGEVEKGIIKLNKALAGSDDASKGAAHALDAIGLNIKELRQLDPAEAFRKIALRMGEFEEGAGKVAVAMDIFGKNGAQLIPFMNDLAEVGDLVSKTTAEQAEQADRYEKNLTKLKATKGELYKVMSMQLLPVANSFVQMLIETTNQTNGVRDSAKGLAADGTLTGVFKEAARAAAALMDVLSALVKGIMQVGSSFSVVWKDISTAAQLVVKGPAALFTHGGAEELNAIIADRNKFVEDANKSMMDRFAGGLTPFSDNLEKQFKKMDQPRAPEPPRSTALKGYQSKDFTPKATGGGGADPYVTELQSLGREAAKLKFQTEHVQEFQDKITSAKVAQVQFDIEQGKFKDLLPDQKAKLLAAAQAVDTYGNSLKLALAGMEFEKQTKQIELNTQMIGLNATAKELAAAKQDLENKGIKEGTELYEQLYQARKKALEEQQAANESPITGIKQGMEDIRKQVEDKATAMRNALTGAFEKGADALTEFVMTGKMQFGDFAKSVINDLVKMIIKQQMFNLLKAATSAFGIPGFANGGAFDGGTQAFANGGVVNSPTLFKFASGGTMRNGLMGEAGPEAIMPLRRGADGKLGVAAAGTGGNTSVVVNVATDGKTSSEGGEGNAKQLGNMIAGVVQAEIVKQKRPGGLLAA